MDRNTRRPMTAIFVGIVILSLGGCMVGPNYTPPSASMPDRWSQAATDGLAEGKANLQTWWTVFDDPTLTRLIEESKLGNLRLKQAYYRVQEARAQRGVATGELFPTLNPQAAYTRESANMLNPFNKATTPVGLTTAGFDTSWEIDVFGGIRRNIESASASYEASVETYRDVMVSLYAEIGLNYADVRTFQERLAYARENVDRQRQTLELVRSKFKSGLVPQLDVRQAESNLANSEAQIPPIQASMVQAINRLGILLGRPPAYLQSELARPGKIPAPPKQSAVGVPVDLLRQRPDIRAAERTLAAQTAQIGVATANMYPRFSLSGSFGWQGAQAHSGDIWNGAWGFGPAMSWNLFDGLRNLYRIQVAEAVAEQARMQYEQTVLSALEEVEDAMVAYTQEQVRRDALRRAVVAQRDAVNLVQDLYRNGLTDFQNVLDTERFLFQQEDQLAVSEGLVTKDLIAVYKALGGGWNPQQADVPQMSTASSACGPMPAAPAATTQPAGK